MTPPHIDGGERSDAGHEVPTAEGSRAAVESQPPLTLEFDGPPPGPELDALIEALLLVAPEPATLDQLAAGAGVTVSDVEGALAALETNEARGWFVQRHNGTIQLATAPRFAGHVRRFLGLERETRLSAPALETLAIVAYQQPVTRAEVEAVRGVDCSGVLATLHGRGLIEAVGRMETVGHPIQYGTTPTFLRHFGLRSLAELPPLGEIEGRDAGVVLAATVAAAEPTVTVQESTVAAAEPTAAPSQNQADDTTPS